MTEVAGRRRRPVRGEVVMRAVESFIVIGDALAVVARRHGQARLSTAIRKAVASVAVAAAAATRKKGKTMKKRTPGAKYILDEDHGVRECADVIAWADWWERNRFVAETTLDDGRWIVTIFLGLDASFGQSPPVFFETTVFQNRDPWKDLVLRQEHAATWDEAQAQHARIVREEAAREEGT